MAGIQYVRDIALLKIVEVQVLQDIPQALANARTIITDFIKKQAFDVIIKAQALVNADQALSTFHEMTLFNKGFLYFEKTLFNRATWSMRRNLGA